MSWKETHAVDQRAELVRRSLQGEPLAALCREFGVSRRTAYKWKQRHEAEGRPGLHDRSRRPRSHSTEVEEAMVCQIVRLRIAHPTWGARKLRAVLERSRPGEELPSESSFKRILDRAGLVEHRRRVAVEPSQRIVTPLRSERPNQIWTIDFKGWWYSRERQRVEPLTIRDDFSRFMLCVQAMENAKTETVRACMSRVFERFGLPEVIRSDNGAPFAASQAPLGLSRLSVWWLSLGIALDRVRPGHPEENGGHERMHRDLAREVETTTRGDWPTQQAELEQWRRTFNEERPHEALAMRVPQEVYASSPRRYDSRPVEFVYPGTHLVRKVNSGGQVNLHNQSMVITSALRGYQVGLEPGPASGAEQRYGVWFSHWRLGDLDVTGRKFVPSLQPPSQPSASPGEPAVVVANNS